MLYLLYFLLIILIVLIILFWRTLVNYKNWNENIFYIKSDENKFNVNKYYNPIEYSEYTKKQRIPKRLHQTFFSTGMDIEYYETCMINRYMNPEYEYYFYDDDDITDFVQTYFPDYMDLYQSIIPGAYKADLFRYMVLYVYGGVYLDCKSSTILPLREMIQSDIGFVSVLDRPKSAIQISFMASIPGHSLLKLCIEEAFENIRNKKYGINNLDITGPQLCGRMFNRLFGRDEMTGIEIKTYTEIDVDIIGMQYFVGDRKYQVLCDKDKKPLISRTCGSYGTSILEPKKFMNSYGVRWTLNNVYK